MTYKIMAPKGIYTQLQIFFSTNSNYYSLKVLVVFFGDK